MKPLKASEILPGRLYQRSQFKHLKDRAEMLRLLNCSIVVNVYDAADEEISSDVTYYSYPMRDGMVRDPMTVEALARTVAANIREIRSAALVHCQAGRNRSGFVSALIVRELLRCPGRDARVLVQTRRPNSLSNRYFCTYLDALGAP